MSEACTKASSFPHLLLSIPAYDDFTGDRGGMSSSQERRCQMLDVYRAMSDAGAYMMWYRLSRD